MLKSMSTAKELLCRLCRVLLMFAALQIIYRGFYQTLLAEDFRLTVLAPVVLPYDGMATLLLFAVGLMDHYAPKQPVALWEKAFSFLCAAVWLIGYSFKMTNDWVMLYGGVLHILSTVLTVVGGGLLLQILLRWAKEGMRRLLCLSVPQAWGKHRFFKAWAFIFACWLPFLLIRYPAGIEYDAYNQVLQFVGIREFTAFSPPFSTFLMGIFAVLGNALHSYTLGAFLFVLFQALVCSAILAYTVVVMARLGVNPVWRVISVLIYALVVIYPNYLTAMVKDSMFSAFVVLFGALLTEYMLLPKSRKPVHHAVFLMATLLMCILRNNGIYIVLFCLVIGAAGLVVQIAGRRDDGPYAGAKRGSAVVLMILLAVCLLHSGYNKLLPEIGIPPGPKAEMFSVPFQQTARYVRDYPEDVTEEEAEAIRAVIAYDRLAEIYDPNLSDQVKGSFTGDMDALGEYFKVWFKMFLRHPDVYFAATLNNSCGYYYPFYQNFYCYTDPERHEGIDYEYPEALSPFRAVLRAYVYTFETTPVLALLGSTGMQTWILLYLACAMLVKKDWRRLYIMVPALVSILVCIASPTFTWNGVRYALPFIYSVPLLLGVCERKLR